MYFIQVTGRVTSYGADVFKSHFAYPLIEISLRIYQYFRDKRKKVYNKTR